MASGSGDSRRGSVANSGGVLDVAFAVVDEIRATSDLSWKHSQAVAQRVMTLLAEYEDITPSHLAQIRHLLLDDVIDVDRCSDRHRLASMLDRLGSMHADLQERSWTLHEETRDVVEFVDSIYRLIERADPRVPLALLSTEAGPILHMVELFELEQRTQVQVALLKLMVAVAHLSPDLADTMSSFTLPRIMVRELATNLRSVNMKESDGGVKSSETVALLEEKRKLCLQLLASILATGTSVTYDNREVISNRDLLVLCVPIGVLGLNVLLAINFQFRNSDDENSVVKACFDALPENPELGQDIIALLNRSVDPLWPFEQNPPDSRPDPALKLATDILLHSTRKLSIGADAGTSSLFYSNDIDVLFDVCTREIVDLPLTSRRTQFLKLLKALVPQLDRNKLGDVKFILGDIECRGKEDVDLVHEIVAMCE